MTPSPDTQKKKKDKTKNLHAELQQVFLAGFQLAQNREYVHQKPVIITYPLSQQLIATIIIYFIDSARSIREADLGNRVVKKNTGTLRNPVSYGSIGG
jgi:hypothetical protein